MNESHLVIGRYDETNHRWLILPSAVDTVNGCVTASTNHLSTFAILQLSPVLSLSSVKAYPMPYDPSLGTLTIDNLTATADIKIFTIAGELVRTVAYVSANGKATWDGKNDSGTTVASGVYIMCIDSPEGKKRLKIAVEK
jgi:hypothetical protein